MFLSNKTHEDIIFPAEISNLGATVEFTSGKTIDRLLDWVCERDFIPGIPFGGRLVQHNYDGCKHIEFAAPYIHPLGSVQWASIPKEHAHNFSEQVIGLAIQFWSEIEQYSGKVITLQDLSRIPFAFAKHYRKNKQRGFIHLLQNL